MRVRQQPPPSQIEIADASSIRRSLRSAFTVQDCKKLSTIRQVAIVNDITTTGATVEDLGKCHKEQGVAPVDMQSPTKASI